MKRKNKTIFKTEKINRQSLIYTPEEIVCFLTQFFLKEGFIISGEVIFATQF